MGGNAGSRGGKQSNGHVTNNFSQSSQSDEAETEFESSGASLETDRDAEQYCGDESGGEDDFVVGIICGFAMLE